MSFRLHVESRPRAAGTAAGMGEGAYARGEQTASLRGTPLPLACLHGWGMNLRVFDPLRDALADQRETIAIDLAGHGASPWAAGHAQFDTQVQDVLAVLPERCALLGWSFGGKLAIEIAARAPQRIAALVLVCVSPKFAQSSDWPHGLDRGSMQAFRTVLEQDFRQTLEDFVWLQLRGSRNAEAARHTLQSALAAQGAPHPEALRNGLDLLDSIDVRARARDVSQPTLLISAQNDRVTPPGAMQWLASAMPQAQLIGIARAGHAPFVSHHQEVSAAVRAFLASRDQAQA